MSNDCRLEQAGIVCCENNQKNLYWRKPDPALYFNIPTLWNILQSIELDWKRETEPFQLKINRSTSESERSYHFSRAFIGLQPHYLKCLFSYVMFFVSLESAYDLFYSELDALNREPVFRVKHA